MYIHLFVNKQIKIASPFLGLHFQVPAVSFWGGCDIKHIDTQRPKPNFQISTTILSHPFDLVNGYILDNQPVGKQAISGIPV